MCCCIGNPLEFSMNKLMISTMKKEKQMDYCNNFFQLRLLLNSKLVNSHLLGNKSQYLIEIWDLHWLFTRLYESTTLFFGDIVGFTKLTAMSTASQTIKFLNDLYNIFDNAIDVFDVYKVEIVGDGYLVASGLPYPNGKQHAKVHFQHFQRCMYARWHRLNH